MHNTTTRQHFKGCKNISRIKIAYPGGKSTVAHGTVLALRPHITRWQQCNDGPRWAMAPQSETWFRETPPLLKCKSTCWVMKAPARPDFGDTGQAGCEYNWGGADCPWQDFIPYDRKAADNQVKQVKRRHISSGGLAWTSPAAMGQSPVHVELLLLQAPCTHPRMGFWWGLGHHRRHPATPQPAGRALVWSHWEHQSITSCSPLWRKTVRRQMQQHILGIAFYQKVIKGSDCKVEIHMCLWLLCSAVLSYLLKMPPWIYPPDTGSYGCPNPALVVVWSQILAEW